MNSITLTLLVTLCILPTATYGQNDKPSHLWSFDKSQSVSTIRDEGSTNTLATLKGAGASFTTVYGATSNNYLTMSKKATLDLGRFTDCSGSNPKCTAGITISLLVRFNPNSSSESTLRAVSGDFVSWALTRNGDDVTFKMHHHQQISSIKMKIKLKYWYLMTFTLSDKTLKVYINGQQVKTNVQTQFNSQPSTITQSNIVLGNQDELINTNYDNLAIWYRGLSADEISMDYEKILSKLVISSQCTSTSTEVCLKWNVRLDAYDLIASTHVRYSKENADDADFKRDSVGKKQDGHCVKKLDADTLYDFTMNTILTDGQTQKSNTVRCKTKNGKPAPPVITEVEVKNSSTIIVSFKRPSPTLGSINSYQVRISKQNQRSLNQYTFVKNLPPLPGDRESITFMLKSLEPSTKYRIQITSINELGSRDPAEVFATTYQEVKELTEVSEVEVTRSHEKQITLVWKPLVPVKKAPHLKYEIRYRKFLGKYRGITLASSNLTLQGLEEKTSYLINIRPLLENEAGPWKQNDFLVKTKDRNECLQPYENYCDGLAKCVNKPDGFVCVCPKGYHGNGRVCRKTHEYVTSSFYCARDQKRGVDWPKTFGGDTAEVPCPVGAEGFAKRHCQRATISSHAIYRHPDLSECVSNEISDLEVLFADRIGQELKAIRELENVTRYIELYGGDIKLSLEYASSVFERVINAKKHQHIEQIAEGITAVASNLIDKKSSDGWFDIPEESRMNVAEQLINFSEQLASKMRQKTNKEFESTQRNLVLQAVKLNKESNLFVKQENNSTNFYSIQLPVMEIARSGAVSNVIYASYDNIGKYLQQPKDGRSVSETVISASVDGVKSLTFRKDPVIIEVPHPENSIVTDPSCVFWNSTERSWSSSGCYVNKSDANSTTCHCYHLTNFAVLMSVTPAGTQVIINSVHGISLRIITIICLTISIVALVIALLTFTCFRFLRSARTSYHRNLVISLLLASIVFLAGINQTQNKVACRVVAALLEYLYLVSFVWMAIEGVLLYYMLRKVFKDQKLFKRKLFQAACWLVPAVYVGIFAVVYPQYYGTEAYCWLSYENGFIWSFAAPVLLIILFNIMVTGLAFEIMSERVKDTDQDFKQQVWYWMKGCFVLMFILGVTWLFGLMHVSSSSVALAYIFSILNALQGLFIFIFHCLIDPKIRQEYVRILKCQPRSEYNEVNGYSTSMRFRKLSTSLTNSNSHSTTIDRNKRLDSMSTSPKTDEKEQTKVSLNSESYIPNEDKQPLLYHNQQSTDTPVLQKQPLPKVIGENVSFIEDEDVFADNSFSLKSSAPSIQGRDNTLSSLKTSDESRDYTISSLTKSSDQSWDNTLSGYSREDTTASDESRGTIKDGSQSNDTLKVMMDFQSRQPTLDVVVNEMAEEDIDDPPISSSERKGSEIRDSVLCEELLTPEQHSEPWRLSMFDRFDEADGTLQQRELEEFSQANFNTSNPLIVNQYDSKENLLDRPPKRKPRKIQEDHIDNVISNSNVESEVPFQFDEQRQVQPESTHKEPVRTEPVPHTKTQHSPVFVNIKMDELSNGDRPISIPSKIINEISDVLVEIPEVRERSSAYQRPWYRKEQDEVAQSPPPKPRRRIRSRRRLDQEGSKSSLELFDDTESSIVESPNSSSLNSSSSSMSLSSPALSFDHESLFKDVDNELEKDCEKLERKKKASNQRPKSPATYRAQMEIIQLKPGTAVISPQRDIMVTEDGDENLAFEF
ncbi:uncharacterized protein [Clytia hemisphaerica]|uniref:Uncharacterized protein n=2 Tax=Clytia hemisphaerica TaxID=252671 RepID=A0A7M5UZR2_9CNID